MLVCYYCKKPNELVFIRNKICHFHCHNRQVHYEKKMDELLNKNDLFTIKS